MCKSLNSIIVFLLKLVFVTLKASLSQQKSRTIRFQIQRENKNWLISFNSNSTISFSIFFSKSTFNAQARNWFGKSWMENLKFSSFCGKRNLNCPILYLTCQERKKKYFFFFHFLFEFSIFSLYLYLKFVFAFAVYILMCS